MEQLGEAQRDSRRPKPPYLQKNSGLKMRQEAARQRRYVPKGGFIKPYSEIQEPLPEVTERISPRRKEQPSNRTAAAKVPVSTRHLSPVSKNKVIGKPPASKVAKGSKAADEADLLTETTLVELEGPECSRSSEAAELESFRTLEIQLGGSSDSPDTGTLLSLISRDQINRLKGLTGVSAGAGDDIPIPGSKTVSAEVDVASRQHSASKPSQEEVLEFRQLKHELEEAAVRIREDETALSGQKAEWERTREGELQKLKRERKALEQHSRAVATLPSRKERNEVEAIEAILDKERKDSRARDSRQKLTVERLRRQIVELQERVTELQQEVHWHEQHSVAAWQGVARPAASPGSDTQRGAAGWQAKPHRHPQLDAKLPAVKVTKAGRSRAANKENSSCIQNTALERIATTLLQDPDVAVLDISPQTEFLVPDLETVPLDDAMLNATVQTKPAAEVVHQQLATSPTADQAEAGPILNFQPPHAKASVAVQAHSSSGDCLQPGESTHLQSNTATADSNGGAVSTGSCTTVACPSAHLQAGVTAIMLPAQRGAASASLEGSPGQQAAAPPLPASEMSVLQRTLPMSAAQQGRLQGFPVLGTKPASAAIGSEIVAAADTLQQLQELRLPASDFARDRFAWQTSEATCRSPERVNQNPFQHPGYLRYNGAQDTPSCKGTFDRLNGECKETRFSNGTVTKEWPDGTCAVHFANGDVKQTFLSGRTEYFYAKVAAWQISNDDGTEVYLFPDGQRQAHHPDGLKELAYPDGSFSLTDVSGHAAKIESLSAAVQQQEPVLLI